MRYRIWCETVSLQALSARATVELLASHDLMPLVAVRPWQVAQAGTALAALRDAGLRVGIWPMLADGDGRWASAASMQKWLAFATQVAAALPCDELVIDLEPAFDKLRNWKALRAAPKSQPTHVTAYRYAKQDLAAAVGRWQASGLRVSTAVIPAVAFDFNLRGAGLMQRALGTPVDDIGADHHSLMAYTSLFEGWSRGLVNRRRAEWLLRVCAERGRLKWGARCGVSLGTVAPGAFGDEPSYRHPDELARDVAICRQAGITELALFDLGGVLRQPQGARAWLQALVS